MLKTTSTMPAGERGLVSGEVVAIMTNAVRLGFSAHRVATALGLTATQLTQLEPLIAEQR